MPTITLGTASLDWNIAGGPTSNYSPNVISELTYSGMESKQYGVVAEMIMPLNMDYALVVGLETNRGELDDGHYRDSDYAGQNRTMEFSRSKGDAGDGKLKDTRASFGIMSTMFSTSSFWRASLGYIDQEQEVRMRNGLQIIALDPDTGNPVDFPAWGLDGLDSGYETHWQGIWAGLKFSFHWAWGAVSLGAKYMDTHFSAVGEWNLREEFAQPKSFDQYDSGFGTEYSVDYTYGFNRDVELVLEYKLQKMQTTNGFDRTYFIDGQSYVTKLNSVEWESENYSAGVRYRF